MSLHKTHKYSLKCKLGLRSCFIFWSEDILLTYAKWNSFNRKHWESHLKIIPQTGGQGTWMRHRNCFKPWVRKKLLWSLTSCDITTTTWFLGKKDTTLCVKGLTESKVSFWKSPHGLVRHLSLWDSDILTPSNSLGSLPGQSRKSPI